MLQGRYVAALQFPLLCPEQGSCGGIRGAYDAVLVQQQDGFVNAIEQLAEMPGGAAQEVELELV